jgi:sulfatase-like protein
VKLSARQFAFHPLLFAAFPVLYLYAHNIQEGVSLGGMLRPLGLAIGGTAILFAIGVLLLRDQRRAGLAVSALVLLFFSYGHVYSGVQGRQIAGIVVGRHATLLTLWFLLAAAAVVASVRAGKRLYELTTVLNVVAAGLVLINVFSVFQYQARARAAEQAALREGDAGFQGHLPDPDEVRKRSAGSGGLNARPDIYYIILDTYAGETGLREVFDFDNTSFLHSLEERGFYVAHQGTANYPRTWLSVASSLNMEYLNYLTTEYGVDSNDTRPLSRLIRYNRVGRFLKSIGYRYIHIGSWWEGSKLSPIADQNVVYGGLSEFDRILYETTALKPIQDEQFRRREWKRVQFAFNAIEKTAGLVGPKFVFAHILLPHSPFTFHPDGRYKTQDETARYTRTRNYLDQIQYANKRIQRVLDTLLGGPEESRPVIVLASDEGPFEGAPSSWGSISSRNLIRKFPNLSTFYLPGVSHAGLYPTITPVNFFRLVFRLYFGADLPTLPDRNYVFRSVRSLYDFTDVTDRVRALVSG